MMTPKTTPPPELKGLRQKTGKKWRRNKHAENQIGRRTLKMMEKEEEEKQKMILRVRVNSSC